MHNAICYYENRVKVLEAAIEGPLEVPQECKSGGACALLLGLLQESHTELAKLRKLFSKEYLYTLNPLNQTVISHQMMMLTMIVLVKINFYILASCFVKIIKFNKLDNNYIYIILHA